MLAMRRQKSKRHRLALILATSMPHAKNGLTHSVAVSIATVDGVTAQSRVLCPANDDRGCTIPVGDRFRVILHVSKHSYFISVYSLGDDQHPACCLLPNGRRSMEIDRIKKRQMVRLYRSTAEDLAWRPTEMLGILSLSVD
ncbi:hypothetical protein ACVDG5_022100 [Mesorhizobium sp. ORM6]